MKKILLLFFLIITLQANARSDEHSRVNNVYVTVFESINIVSANYDTRFPGSSVFGWHAGIGYNPFDSGGVSLPVGVNAILGSRASKFEIGVNATPYLNRDYEYIDSYKWKCGLAVGANIGYRLQRKNGFFFRAGLSPTYGLKDSLDSFGLLFINILPYLSFGYTF